MAVVEFGRLPRADEPLNVDQRGAGGMTRERKRRLVRALAASRKGGRAEEDTIEQ